MSSNEVALYNCQQYVEYQDDDAEEVTVAELHRVISNMHVVSIRNDKKEDTKDLSVRHNEKK